MQSLWAHSARERILVVESDSAAEGVAGLIAAKFCGCKVLRAGSGGEGLRLVRNQAVALVLTAGKLADMTGDTFIAALSKQGASKSRPACVLLDGHNAAAAPAGAVDAVPWPGDAGALVRVVERALERQGLKGRIRFARRLGWVVIALMPVAFALGAVLGLVSR